MNRTFKANGITFARNNHLILDDASIEVAPGEIVGLLGSNGSGKTTFFDVICGLKKHSFGTLSTGLHSDSIAYLAQQVTVPDALRLSELSELIGSLSKSGSKINDNPLSNATEKEQEKYKLLSSRRANNCSYGEKRWFVLMILLSLDADLYILDEPTAGVDPEYRFYIWAALSRIKSMNKMVIFSTHHASEIENNCDYFFFLKDGKARRFETASAFLHENSAASLEEAFVRYVAGDSLVQQGVRSTTRK